MKYSIPEISWHNRDPVLSVDFQPRRGCLSHNEPCRLATGGTDSHVLIWYISTTETGVVNLDIAADLTRHQKAVNVVRWSPNGEFLASGDDESIIFIWKKGDKEPAPAAEGEEQQKETWIIHKTLRGHVEDVLDISWSPCSSRLVSGSVDNKLIFWDLNKGRYSDILGDHKGFVQGVGWDPQGQYIASACTDRVFRTFDINSKKVISRSSKAVLPFPKEHPFNNVKVRLYHDDTLQTFYRRVSFSPDGMLIAVPAGKIEPEQGKMDVKPINAVYIYTRYSLKVPACILPCGESPALACNWSQCCYTMREEGPKPVLPLSHRMILGVATKRCLLVYDTQQKTPIALVSNIHYTRLTDLTWSPDGNTLVTSSTDGFCSIIMFSEGELGQAVPHDTVQNKSELPEETKEKQKETKPDDIGAKVNAFSFNIPTKESPTAKSEKEHSQVKIDVLEEVAMSPWPDNSLEAKINPSHSDINVNDSQDLKLYYDGTREGAEIPDEEMVELPKTETEDAEMTKVEQGEATFLQKAKVIDIKEPVLVPTAPSPKTPRRVTFITLSSPKNSKKKL